MIAIIDYNAGNLKSVEKALHFLGQECVVTRDFHEIEQADKVILPGVGAFGDAMGQLKKYELDKVIRFLVSVWDCSFSLREAMRVRAWKDFISLTEQSGGFRISRDSRSRISDGIL